MIEQQPCQNYTRREDSFEGYYGGDPYIHQCPICHGFRAFCVNCSKDHHKGGWDSCKPITNTKDEI